MATSNVAVTPGTGKNLATNSISEDAITKELSRIVLNSSGGVELAGSDGIKIDSSQLGTLGPATAANCVPIVPPSDYALYAPKTDLISGVTAAMTGIGSTQLLAAPGSGLRNYITTIIVSNSHATVGTDIFIQDGVNGVTLITIPAAAAFGGAVITLPTPLRQPTVNTGLFCQNGTTGSSTKVSAVGYKAA